MCWGWGRKRSSGGVRREVTQNCCLVLTLQLGLPSSCMGKGLVGFQLGVRGGSEAVTLQPDVQAMTGTWTTIKSWKGLQNNNKWPISIHPSCWAANQFLFKQVIRRGREFKHGKLRNQYGTILFAAPLQLSSSYVAQIREKFSNCLVCSISSDIQTGLLTVVRLVDARYPFGGLGYLG